MLRTLLRSAAALAGLITWVAVAAMPVPADGETTDGTLTVIVNRDVDGNQSYDATIDRPQPGIGIAVTDASGARVTGVTDTDGTFVLHGTRWPRRRNHYRDHRRSRRRALDRKS